jgi:hypothetical protein
MTAPEPNATQPEMLPNQGARALLWAALVLVSLALPMVAISTRTNVPGNDQLSLFVGAMAVPDSVVAIGVGRFFLRQLSPLIAMAIRSAAAFSIELMGFAVIYFGGADAIGFAVLLWGFGMLLTNVPMR